MNYFKEFLAQQGYQLAEEIRDGKWHNTPGNERPAASAEIIAELRRRCPGHTHAEYARSIADGLFNSR